MPWTPAQHRLFEWAAHSPTAASAAGYNIKPQQAATMASEGVINSTAKTLRNSVPKPILLAQGLKSMK